MTANLIHSVAGTVKTCVNLRRFHGRVGRKLEIGPGQFPLKGFETLNIVPGRWVDYVRDAARPLPFDDETFELIHASHVLEHIPWYQTETILREWVRVIRPGGRLEIWVPDALAVCKALIALEEDGDNPIVLDGWDNCNAEQNPYHWVSGRLYAYGDGQGDLGSPNWHRAAFTPKSLAAMFEKVGLTRVRRMDRHEARGHDHGFINLGMLGFKP